MNFEFVTLTVTFDLLLKKFNIGHNFFIERDRTFIFGMCIPYYKTFPTEPYISNMWPWPWPLTYFWKTLTLAVTLMSYEIKLSYLACVFLMTRPFQWYHKIFYVWPWPWPLTYFSQTPTLPPQTYTMPCGALPDFVSILVFLKIHKVRPNKKNTFVSGFPTDPNFYPRP